MGRRPIGKAAMTPTQYQARWRARVRRKKIWGANADSHARRPTPRRDDLDFWPTPPCLRKALVQIVLPHLPPATIWEAAAGDGVLADDLSAAGRKVIASDIDPQCKGILRLNFLTEEPPVGTKGTIMATNPPFGILGARFLRRTMELIGVGHLAGAVLLARNDQLSTLRRAEAFNRAAFEFCCAWRPVWIAGSEESRPRWTFTWIVWLRGHNAPCVIRRILPSEIGLE